MLHLVFDFLHAWHTNEILFLFFITPVELPLLVAFPDCDDIYVESALRLFDELQEYMIRRKEGKKEREKEIGKVPNSLI